jgi:hypothetical protein
MEFSHARPWEEHTQARFSIGSFQQLGLDAPIVPHGMPACFDALSATAQLHAPILAGTKALPIRAPQCNPIVLRARLSADEIDAMLATYRVEGARLAAAARAVERPGTGAAGRTPNGHLLNRRVQQSQ